MRPHRRQPTRLPRPWDSPGKNTGVGCHFLLQCMKVKSEREVAQSCPILSDPMDYSPPGSSIHGIFQARVLKWGAICISRAQQNDCYGMLAQRMDGWMDGQMMDGWMDGWLIEHDLNRLLWNRPLFLNQHRLHKHILKLRLAKTLNT